MENSLITDSYKTNIDALEQTLESESITEDSVDDIDFKMVGNELQDVICGG